MNAHTTERRVCGSCGYPFHGWSSNKCPECGVDTRKHAPVIPHQSAHLEKSLYWGIITVLITLMALMISQLPEHKELVEVAEIWVSEYTADVPRHSQGFYFVRYSSYLDLMPQDHYWDKLAGRNYVNEILIVPYNSTLPSAGKAGIHFEILDAARRLNPLRYTPQTNTAQYTDENGEAVAGLLDRALIAQWLEQHQTSITKQPLEAQVDVLTAVLPEVMPPTGHMSIGNAIEKSSSVFISGNLAGTSRTDYPFNYEPWWFMTCVATLWLLSAYYCARCTLRHWKHWRFKPVDP